MRKLTLIVLVLLFCCASVVSANEDVLTPSGIPYSELKDRVDEYVSEYIGTSSAGANVLIIKDDEIIMNTSYGFANIENQIKVTPNTVFEWGSVTKLLVWTSVMQLVEQGKLELNEDIRTYLPEGFLTKLQYNAPITMLNLMHHNAGWEDRFIDLFYKSADEIKPLEEMLHIVTPYQIHEPGTIVAYSNYGVALAAFIVEHLTGQPFYEYVNEHIFSILNMNDTSIHPKQQDNLNIATKRDAVLGYRSSEGELSISKNERIFIGLYPAGSAIGTIGDLAKFMMALMPGDGENSALFQSNSTLDEMLTTSDFYNNGLPRNAHGFWRGLYAVDVLGHAGNTDSFSSNFIFSNENNLGLIIMTNQQNEVELSYGLPTLLFGEYSPTNVTQSMPNVENHKEGYYWARQPYKGFGKLYGVFTLNRFEVPGPNKMNAFGGTYKQISPSLYQSTDGSNDYLHVTLNSGQFEKISTLTSDMLPISQSSKIFKLLSIVAITFSILYSVITLLISFIQSIKNRNKTAHTAISKKWETILLLANIIPVINVIILFYRTLNYTPYAQLRIHFLINYAYVFVVAVCIAAQLLEWRKKTILRGQKIRIALCCFSSLLIIILIFGWELYY
ncbi:MULTISPECIES: serine hydrolase domain-containing protein [Solibacillus]|uniref:Beta-lactamase family protein n=1 Tax=Solibacillus merdavium TaxID=2762218 RepID=A0ABR8XLY7_9BACL|nr:serine hydrolase domain-containing protein [Solibacillus merdavium]MBD8032957.1 beta-lactamase family protein [Solibacillus merdavium]